MIPNPFRALGLLGWVAVAAVAVLLIAAAWWQAGAGARREAAVARTGAALSASRTASAAQATETIAAGAERDAATDRQTQETAHAIDNAPGAHQRLDPALARAGLVGLCQRAAYRGRPECLQLARPGVAP
jgi:Flp pilus assembly protein TadB